MMAVRFTDGGSQFYWWWQSVILWQSVLLVVAVSFTDGGSQLSCGNTPRFVGNSIFHNGDQNNMTEIQPGIIFLGVQNTTHYKSFNFVQTASVVYFVGMLA